MPEIAEVALTAEILQKYLRNQSLTKITFGTGRYSKNAPDNYKQFKKALPMKIRKVDSHGKFLWFELKNSDGDNWYIWNTFGLNGMWKIIDVDEKVKNRKHVSCVLTTKKYKAIFYIGIHYGTIKFSDSREELDKKIKKLGPDFLKDDDFDINKVTKYKIPIVKILMDQGKVGSGIGNYLVAEILYRAKIAPQRLGSSLSKSELKKLKHSIKYVVKLSYLDNETGYMVYLTDELAHLKKKNYHPEIKICDTCFEFQIYKRKTDPKGNPIEIAKIVKNGKSFRSTHWVPAVQK